MVNLRLILGSMGFGGALKEAPSHAMLKEWIKLGYSEVDTALVYQDGKTEKIMGKLHLCRDPSKVKIACKVNPKKGFKAEEVVAQLNESLSSLQVSSVDILYLHLPDHTVPVKETLRGVDQLYKEGKFKEFGLSNYASWEVVDIYHICKQQNYVLPSVYQGMYNALTRDIELELIPALRRLGMRFYVYNPLAGGLLTGKYDVSAPTSEQPVGRFFPSKDGGWTSRATDMYQKRFWRDSYTNGVAHVKGVVQKVYGKDMSLLNASMSWLSNHSQLVDGDGIILGCSKLEHLQPNIDGCKGPPLDDEVVRAFDDAWNAIKSDCPKYNR